MELSDFVLAFNPKSGILCHESSNGSILNKDQRYRWIFGQDDPKQKDSKTIRMLALTLGPQFLVHLQRQHVYTCYAFSMCLHVCVYLSFYLPQCLPWTVSCVFFYLCLSCTLYTLYISLSTLFLSFLPFDVSILLHSSNSVPINSIRFKTSDLIENDIELSTRKL